MTGRPFAFKDRMLIMILCVSACPAFSDGAHFNAGFEQGIQSAAALQGKALNVFKQYRPQDAIKNYSDRPKEADYQNNADAIKSDASAQMQTDPAAKSIMTGIDERQKKFNFSKDPNSKEIQNIKQRAETVYDVITGQYGDCTKQTHCTTSYQTEACEEAPASTLQYCKKTLNIEIVPHPHYTHYGLFAALSVGDHSYAGVSINAVNGQINFLGPHDASFYLNGRLPGNLDCHALQGQVIAQQGGAGLDSINVPSCANGLVLDFHISGGHEKNLQIDMVYTTVTYEAKDHWEDQCTGLEHSSQCVLQAERCIAGQSTHVVQGVPVARDCWEKEASYQCGGTSGADACRTFRDEGCEQVGSICEDTENNACMRYQQTFRCPIKQCTDVGMVCNGETYCLDGNCVKQQKQADPDFQRAVSALSAAHDAATDFTKMGSIFAGTKKTCDKLVLGFLDCCADTGWGKDHIASCSQEEKDLKTDKDNLLAVYVGEYCKNDQAGICIEHRKSYCVFPSRLARIVQQQGRGGQLHIGFGDPGNADCRGITREEFAQLDLSKMDFSDFYADISNKAHVEDEGQLHGRITDKATSWEQEKKSNG